MDSETLHLLKKYDVPTPRYTSYPTVPFWQPETISPTLWTASVNRAFLAEGGEVSIYIHLPFCETLCTFCACNKRITKNHAVEARYMAAVIKEWSHYRQLFPKQAVIREIHLGGGTPTFFQPENLSALIREIVKGCVVAPEHEFSVEVHPNYTTENHLKELCEVGFNRLSIGVQDFDPAVQFAINRIQSFGQTRQIAEWARLHYFKSVNVDLVYGLPHQTAQHVASTIEQVRQLSPDRIAFYSYAHVPWKSKAQRRYTEEDLPCTTDKWKMYQAGREQLLKHGFFAIGMDHFSLPEDGLYKAYRQGRLHRNFMGYTTTSNKLIIGLGCSSISDSGTAFVQNEKDVEAYQDKIEQSGWSFTTGHRLNEEDEKLRNHILDLMCRGETRWTEFSEDRAFIASVKKKLEDLAQDGLLLQTGSQITVTERGRLFVRNICAAFDARLFRQSSPSATFSNAI